MSAYGGPEINDSGLVLALDAANTKSAPASTTWTDLSGNANNGTLTNGPVYIFGRSAISCTGSAGNRLEIAHTTALNLNGGAYTIECWVYPTTSFATYVTLLGKQSLFTAGYSLWINSGYPAFGLNGGYNSITSNTILTLNNWHHIAVVSDGSTYTRLFLNGVQVGTSATLLNTSTTSLLTINGNKAGTNWDADYPFRGLISDVRIVKGTAVYTGAFTRPSAPLTAIANTQLLTCNDRVIKDSSPNALTISTVGTVAVDNTTVSSVLFDGTDDYATVSNNISPGTGDFAVSVFVYKTDTITNRYVWDFGSNGGTLSSGTSITAGFRYYNPTVGYILGPTHTVNTWYNLVVSRISGITYFYSNGSLVNSAADTGNIGFWGTTLNIGRYGGGGNIHLGSISNLFVYKGIGLTAAQVLQNFNALRGRYGL